MTHHHHHHNGWVNTAAFAYLMQNNPAAAEDMRALTAIGVGVFALGALSFFIAVVGLNAGGFVLVGIFAAVWSAYVRFVYDWMWNDTKRQQRNVAAQLTAQEGYRSRFEGKLATVTTPEELASLRRIWDCGELTIAQEEGVVALISRWASTHPCEYPSQVEARAAELTRLCVCAPGRQHADCEPPQWDLRALRAAQQKAVPPPSLGRSGVYQTLWTAAVGACLLSAAIGAGAAAPVYAGVIAVGAAVISILSSDRPLEFTAVPPRRPGALPAPPAGTPGPAQPGAPIAGPGRASGTAGRGPLPAGAIPAPQITAPPPGSVTPIGLS